MKRVKGGGFGGIDPKSKGDKIPKPQDIVELADVGPDFKAFRCIGDVSASLMYWITIETAKGEFNIGKPSLAYDPELDTIDDAVEDPYRDIPNPVKETKHYYVNVIDRDLQEDEPKKKGKPTKDEKKTGLKTKGSEAWTPVRVLRITPKVAGELQALRQLNKHKVKGARVACDITDEKYGIDIFFSFNKDADSPGDMYKVQKGDHSPLTDEEKGYLVWDLTKIHQKESLEVARKEAENLSGKSPESEEDDEDEDDLPAKSKKKKKSSKDDAPKKKKKKSSRDDDDAPKKKKKKSSDDGVKKKKKTKKSSL